MEITMKPALESDIEIIKPYLSEYGLDNENLDYRQFYIAEIENKIAGFGRIKKYEDIYEIASIGVLEQFRGNGVGSKIIKKLLSIVPSREIWITTIIPSYFEQFGFREDNNIPDEILLKCKRVCERQNKTTRNSSYMRYRKVSYLNE